jgi:15-cis-phytoene synthase
MPSLAEDSPQAIMNHHAKSFSWAARFLERSTRKDAALLYAFARTADDYADEERLGTLQVRLQQLAELRLQAFAINVSASGLANLASATGAMLRHYKVPETVLACLMDSLQADAGPRAIGTQQELLRFAYGVAGTVGQMMRPLLGAPSSADPCAIALGVAMQLTNIARDVVEDAKRGRCYVPTDWGVSLQTLAAPRDANQRAQAFAVLRKLLALADDFYAYAQVGVQAIPLPNRRAIRIATALYQAIGHKVLRAGPENYWKGRTSLSAVEKSWLVAKTLFSKPTVMPIARDVWLSDLAHLVDTAGFPR